MAAIDVSGGGGAGISLTKDIFVNTSLIGAFDATEDVNVFLQDPGANPITPVSSVLVGNDLTITANIPVPSGAALQFPNPSQGISYSNYDTGWRAQNNWYSYTPPTYPAKYAQLDTTLGSNQWYRLKTALTVGGVTNTQRFVDVNGVQSWGILNNANIAVVDKLTGLMFSRVPVFVSGGSWRTNMVSAFNYSVTINSILYNDWYMISASEMMAIMGLYLPASASWLDGVTGQPIVAGISSNYRFLTADADEIFPPQNSQGYNCRSVNGGVYNGFSSVQDCQTFWVHNATNLIS